MKKEIIVVSLIVMSLFGTAQAASSDRYVSTNGSNNNNGLTPQTAWRTIQYAVNTIVAGTIYILAGTYNEQITIGHSGTSGNWIMLTDYNGEVIIDGTGVMTNGGLIQAIGKNYIKVSGLTIRDSACYGVNVQGVANTNNIIIADCNIYNCSMSGIIFYPADGYWADSIIIENNTIHDVQNGWYSNPSNECISVANARNSIVRFNYMYDNHRISIDIKDHINNVKIYGNSINATPTCPVQHDPTSYRWSNSGIYTDAYNDDEYNVDVYSNTVWGNTTGFTMGTEQGGTLTDVHFFNNIYNGTGHAFQINNHWVAGQVPGVNHVKRNCSIMNNVVTGMASMCFQLTDKPISFQGQNFTVRNNIFDTPDHIGINVNASSWIVDPSTILAIDHNLFNVHWSFTYGTDYITGTPGFINPDGDYKLTSDSLCINTGNNLYATGFDFEGNERPVNTTVDIGAYEYGVHGDNPSMPPFGLGVLFLIIAAVLIGSFLFRRRL